MSQRIPSYGLGGPAPYGGVSNDMQQGGSVLDQVRPFTSKIEDALDNISEPLKP
jgi:hypothetical protein